MPNMEVKILQNRHKHIAAGLRYIGGKVKRPRALYARWGVQGLKWIDENFKRQGGLLAEGKWAALSPSTLKQRKRKQSGKGKGKYGPKILMISGKLRMSFVAKATPKGTKLAPTVDYEIFHESDKPRKKLPQRRMLPRQKDKTFMSRLGKTTKNYIREVIREA